MIRNVLTNTALEKAEKKQADVHEVKIGNVTYQVVSHFKEDSQDTAAKKIERLIDRDLKSA